MHPLPPIIPQRSVKYIFTQQIDANRRNAQKSTGPRTPEGKARSALNALSHGLLAKEAVLQDENEAEFNALLDAYIGHHQPATPQEEFYVREMACCDWRLRRSLRTETSLYERALDQNRDTEPASRRFGRAFADRQH